MHRTLALGVLLILGCAQSNKTPAPAEGQWHLKGTRLIGCCCNAPCPCRINKAPTQCHGCEYTTAVHIDEGFIGKTRMDGMTWAMCGLGFAEDKNTNWVAVYVTDKATDEQLKALQDWLNEGMKNLNEKKRTPYIAGKFAGVFKKPMTWTASANREEFSYQIRGVLDFKVKAIRNPGHPEPVTSAGIFDDFGNSFVHCDTLAHVYKDASLKYDGWDLTGKQSNYAHFVIGSDIKPDYVIGWGCWSAHKELGSDSNYQEKSIGHPKK
jgi:hypothetical protein